MLATPPLHPDSFQKNMTKIQEPCECICEYILTHNCVQYDNLAEPFPAHWFQLVQPEAIYDKFGSGLAH